MPDGSVEEHSSARESDGTERVTVTRYEIGSNPSPKCKMEPKLIH